MCTGQQVKILLFIYFIIQLTFYFFGFFPFSIKLICSWDVILFKHSEIRCILQLNQRGSTYTDFWMSFELSVYLANKRVCLFLAEHNSWVSWSIIVSYFQFLLEWFLLGICNFRLSFLHELQKNIKLILIKNVRDLTNFFNLL